MVKWGCALVMVGLLGGSVGCKKKLDEIKAEREELVEELGGKPKRITDHVKKVVGQGVENRAAEADKAFE